MKRKVVKHGEGTLTVSLPSDWVRNNNLKQGQLVNVEPSRGKVIISLENKSFEPVTIPLEKGGEWYIGRIIRHLYTSGFDEINIKYDSPKQLPQIREDLKLLTGLEIVKSDNNVCTLKCMIHTQDSEYDQIVKKIMWILLSKLDYLLEEGEKGNFEMSYEIKELHITLCRLCNLCKRLINKREIFDSVHSKYAYDFFNAIIEISLLINYSYDHLSSHKNPKLSEAEIILLKEVRDHYHGLYNAVINEKKEKVQEFFETRKNKFSNNLDLIKKEDPVIVHYFLMMLRTLTPIGNHIAMLNVEKERRLEAEK
ncbi:MAG: AbrB/MazE/SpoVT family DNA-binding domain-containing protein [Nanoarchaeota archaeon]